MKKSFHLLYILLLASPLLLSLLSCGGSKTEKAPTNLSVPPEPETAVSNRPDMEHARAQESNTDTLLTQPSLRPQSPEREETENFDVEWLHTFDAAGTVHSDESFAGAATKNKTAAEKAEAAALILHSDAVPRVPDDFPFDVPQYPHARVHMSMEDEDFRFFLQASTADSMETVIDFFETETAKEGWEQPTSTDKNDAAPTLCFEKKGRFLTINLSEEEEQVTFRLVTGFN